MATVNPLVRLKNLFAESPKIRGEVISVDTDLKRCKVEYSNGSGWVNGEAEVGDSVLVQNEALITILPKLPFKTIIISN